ncbi:MAG: type II toxin-antitoxin system PemK/MazF family toxin [Firmicutes bacterium]|nr:type II toxin-antitoxin system PemK/MazF family toxin [Bacillota bacterium]
MEKLIAGDVVVVPFPFTTLERAKRRPALVLATLSDGDYIFCQITSRDWPHAILLRQSDFSEGMLPHDSHVRPEKLFTGNQSLVLSRVGHTKSAVQKQIYVRLLEIFEGLHGEINAVSENPAGES